MAGKYYYLDFVRTGGVLESAATREREPAVSVGYQPAFEEVLKREFSQAKSVVAETAKVGRGSRNLYSLARKFLCQHILPEPGLVSCGNDFYTGWFRVKVRPGFLFPAFVSGRPDEGRSNQNPKHLSQFSPYFYLEAGELAWLISSLEKGFLTRGEFQQLAAIPHENQHPRYQQLIGLPFQQYLRVAHLVLDGFGQRFRQVDFKTPKEADGKFILGNLLDLAILNNISQKTYKGLLREISQRMQELGIYLYPLDKGCVIAYFDGHTIRYRPLPIPENRFFAFQRYIALGQNPLTKPELKEKYYQLVGNNPRLFVGW